MLQSFRADEFMLKRKCLVAGGNFETVIEASDIDPRDGHLGYTQILRLMECSRYLTFERVSREPNISETLVDCTLVNAAINFACPIVAGEVRLLSEVARWGHSSFEMLVEVYQQSRLCASARLTLVGLDAEGNKVQLRRPPTRVRTDTDS